MNCEQTTGLLSDRLKGLLSAEDERRLEAHLGDCPACREEAEAVGSLWVEMGALDDDVPHERMRARFHAALAAYDQTSRATSLDRVVERVWPQRPVFQAAIALALLVIGVGVGRGLPSPAQAEIAGLRRDIRGVSLALLDHQSASQRLLGIEWSRRADSYAPVIDALLETVRNDANVNVRLAAVEALSASLDRPEVAAALTEALSRQDSPLVQVTLAETLLEGGVDGAVVAVERVLGREDLDPSVRDYLRAVLQEADDESDDPAPPGDLL